MTPCYRITFIGSAEAAAAADSSPRHIESGGQGVDATPDVNDNAIEAKSTSEGYPTLGYPTLGYLTLGYPTLGYPALGYPALGYHALGYHALGHLALGYPAPYPRLL